MGRPSAGHCRRQERERAPAVSYRSSHKIVLPLASSSDEELEIPHKRLRESFFLEWPHFIIQSLQKLEYIMGHGASPTMWRRRSSARHISSLHAIASRDASPIGMCATRRLACKTTQWRHKLFVAIKLATNTIYA